MKEYKDIIKFEASAKRLYDILTKESLHGLVTDAETEIGNNIGDEFRLFGGAIDGKILNLDAGRQIEWKWFCHVSGWPEDHFSNVKFDISEIDDFNCELQIVHSQIPDDAYESVVEGWQERYWDSIKRFVQKK